LTVTDTEGNPVEITEDTDFNAFLDNCTEEERTSLDAYMSDFVRRYVRFSNSTSAVSKANYYDLAQILLKGSPLDKRCKGALEGMAYGVSQRYKIKSTQINWCTDIGNDRYLCDVTYVVDIMVSREWVENIFNVKLVVVRDGNSLKAETLRNY